MMTETTAQAPYKNGEMAKESASQSDGSSRVTWSGKLDFIMSMIGLAVGLGNIWRFPYLCYKNGGGAFLVCYLTTLVCCAAPLVFLEVSLGQFMSRGGIGAWDICPIFKGVGICATLLSGYGGIYYNVIMAWAFYYIAMSINTVLPWSHCDNSWNTPRCRVVSEYGEFNVTKPSMSDHNTSTALIQNGNAVMYNISHSALVQNGSAAMYNISHSALVQNGTHTVDPTEEFWERGVLQMSDGIEEADGIVWQLALALLLSWLLIYGCVWKGIRVSGKIVYVTSTFPYVMLAILLIRGLTLDGAATGIAYYVRPKFYKLMYPQVWIDAGTQVLFSYGLGVNCQVALGSYNKFHNQFIKDSIVVMVINSATSIVAGFAVFSVLGFMANQESTTMDKVTQAGPGLIFIAYPKALSEMSGGPVLAVLFFLMIAMVGMSSMIVGAQSIVTVVCDEIATFRRPYGREAATALYCSAAFLIGLSMVTRGGVYVLQLFDYYSCSGMAMLWVCFFQCVAISWVFGISRYSDCVAMMTGAHLNMLMKICLVFIAPVVLAALYVWLWSQFELLKYNGVYVYPDWAQALGLCIAFSSMLCVPVYAAYKLCVTPGTTLAEKWSNATTPILPVDRIPDHWPEKKLFLKEKDFLLTENTGLPEQVKLTNIITCKSALCSPRS